LEGGLADNHFGAQLDQVVRNPDGCPVYGNPDEFFALSYPTQGLKDMMSRAFRSVRTRGRPNETWS